MVFQKSGNSGKAYSGEPPNDALDDLRGEVGNLKQMCTDMKQEIDKLRNDFNNLLDYIYLVSMQQFTASLS